MNNKEFKKKNPFENDMKKRFLSVILAVLMVFGTFSVFAEDAVQSITVYVSVSNHGEIAKDKNGSDMACRELALDGNTVYTLDDAFLAMHELPNLLCNFFQKGLAKNMME